MKYVELIPGVRSSAIGFGCAPILGSVDRETSLRALNIAFEEGINHFDLARSYGFGEAERLVGSFIKGRRDTVVIATKFGIEATVLAQAARPLKSVMRQLLGKRRGSGSPPGSSAAAAPKTSGTGRMSQLLHVRKPITAEGMRRSLEKSLRELQTDYVDYFFVHEPLHTIDHVEELAGAMDRIKQQGKVRAWGMALMVSQWESHQEYLSRFEVLQFDNSPYADHYSRMATLRGPLPNILFSPFRSLSKTAPNREPPSKILKTLAQDFPRSVVLCSMFTEKHIRENAKAV